MATATIKLTTIGTSAGPFNLYSNVDSYAVAFETGLTRAQLLAGYISNGLPNLATVVRVKSTIYCINYIDINVTNCYSGTTTTTTAAP